MSDQVGSWAVLSTLTGIIATICRVRFLPPYLVSLLYELPLYNYCPKAVVSL